MEYMKLQDLSRQSSVDSLMGNMPLKIGIAEDENNA